MKTIIYNSYRFGFNGQEKDDEIANVTGAHLNYKFRIYDSRIGRFFSIDPLAAKYPYNSTYAFSENSTIAFIELEGLEKLRGDIVGRSKTGKIKIEVVTADGGVGYSEDFSFTLYDIDGTKLYTSYNNDFGTPELNERYKGFKKDEGYITDVGRISLYPSKDDKTLKFWDRIAINKLIYQKEKIVSKGHNYMTYNKNTGHIHSVKDLTPDVLIDHIRRVVGNLDYNRLDVYVPEDQQELFLDIANETNISEEMINFTEQKDEGTTMEIMPVKVETETVTYE